MSYMKRVLEYVREGYTEAEAFEIVALERKAAEREARRPIPTTAEDALTCTADCCAEEDVA